MTHAGDWFDDMDSGPALPIIADRKKLEVIVGRELREEAFSFAPWGHRLLIVRALPDEYTSGGLVIPDTSKDMPALGWVMAVGPAVGARRDLTSWCPLNRTRLLGCQVLFGSYAGAALEVGEGPRRANQYDSEYSVLLEDDVWGTVGEPPKDPPLG